jgi:hypothetical protein
MDEVRDGFLGVSQLNIKLKESRFFQVVGVF